MWSVRILSGAQSGQIFELKLGKNVFGRGAHCDVKILSVGISKEHCEINVYKDKAMIVDLKSSNGTFVNGVKIQNSILKLGDKFSLFEVIMDVIPTADLRPQIIPLNSGQRPNRVPTAPGAPATSRAVTNSSSGSYSQLQMQGALALDSYTSAQAGGGDVDQTSRLKLMEPDVSFKEKIENYIDDVVMLSIYRAASLIPFRQVLMGFILLFVLAVTAFSLIPLNTITRESNFNEAAKRAKSVVRTLARMNEQALVQGQFTSLSVAEALKEDGVKEALIIQQSDGAIVAPYEKAGKESSRAFVNKIRTDMRALVERIDSKTMVASQPIGAYDINSGENLIKYHAVVYYDISSLNVDDNRILSLFMQTLLWASIFGFILHFLFMRLIQYPLLTLNKQIDTALRDKVDRTEVLFDYPAFQGVVANVNLLLSRVLNAPADINPIQKQNRDFEFRNLVEMLDQPGVVINDAGLVVALNSQFEQLSQMTRDQLQSQNYATITDAALMQNFEALIAKAKANPYEKHFDRIPFAQFECEIAIQACLSLVGEVEYYFIVMRKVGDN